MEEIAKGASNKGIRTRRRFGPLRRTNEGATLCKNRRRAIGSAMRAAQRSTQGRASTGRLCMATILSARHAKALGIFLKKSLRTIRGPDTTSVLPRENCSGVSHVQKLVSLFHAGRTGAE